ncbi:MAG: hypothetical protein KF915_06955 [Polyangiaceae bacterium]|nr:hypothetical protein [Polyangiaceae bacterium]
MLNLLRKTSVAVILSVATLAAGCGGLSYEVKGKPPATGAIARIDGKTQEDTKTTRLTIEVEFLQPPADLDPKGTGFVVWFRKNNASQWSRLGNLDYNESSRKGTLKDFSVPELKFELAISVEGGDSAASPTTIVFTQLVSDD